MGKGKGKGATVMDKGEEVTVKGRETKVTHTAIQRLTVMSKVITQGTYTHRTYIHTQLHVHIHK